MVSTPENFQVTGARQVERRATAREPQNIVSGPAINTREEDVADDKNIVAGPAAHDIPAAAPDQHINAKSADHDIRTGRAVEYCRPSYPGGLPRR